MADENKIANNQTAGNDQNSETIISGAKDIINLASEAVTETKTTNNDISATDDGGSKTITDGFVGLPLETLIGAPLIAAAKAQQELTATYIETVMGLAYGENKDNKKKVNSLDLTIERPIISKSGDKVQSKNLTINAPILSLVPIPAFTMDEIVVDFDMEVKNSEVKTDKQNANVESAVGYKSFWGLNANIKGSIAADSEHKRETDTSATYKIHARAVQQPPTSGMDKLTDILTQAMEPIIVNSPVSTSDT